METVSLEALRHSFLAVLVWSQHRKLQLFRNSNSSRATSGQNSCLENQRLSALLWDLCWLMCFVVFLL